MKQLKLSVLFLFCLINAFGQNPGDTLTVQTFQYGSTTRDTVVHFPDTPGLQIEKVLMLYNIRCKNGLVSPPTAGQTNLGCGEWDYSCNTYVTDSSRVDSMYSSRPSHTVSNFSGSIYPYTTTPYYQLYQYPLTQSNFSIVSETQFSSGSGSIALSQVLDAAKKSGRSQFLFTATELINLGMSGGDIAGIILQAQNNADVFFMKVQMKNTSLTQLDPAEPELLGLNEVFNNHVSFVNGANRIQFYTPFNWDGVSNVLIDFSFTNSTPGNPLQITSSAAVNMGMYAANGFYLNTAGGVVTSLPAASLSPIHNEITVGFWSRGNAGISTQNTSIIEGVDNGNRRQLNIHLPWSNSNVYFDCGNLGSGYDRINKAATVAELQGNWNYWTFTKNAVSGIMNIYLNGMLWHTGSAKTNTIQIDSLLFGANITSGNPFKGDVDELSIWDKELNAGTITAWMNKAIDATHPDYAHLLAYYKLDEGSGLLIQDSSVSNQQAQFPFSPSWHFTRGNELSRLFQPLSARPDITFLKGTYTLTNTNILAYDSVQAEPNIVKAYAVVPHPGTIQSDEVTVVSTNLYWLATYRYVYNGLSGALIDSLPVSAIDTIHILNLSYIDRFPMKFEIMSFVTPYGINLDLGMNGKTWTFDMTDFLPVLKGNKRITVERGGKWQENMDIKFLFIVGTPPHDVLDIKNIWRQPGNCNYNDIVTDKYFEPRNVPLLNTGKSFKIRTMITGHGQEGEFIPRMHALNVNGGANEFEWQVYKKCAFNPVYPQGGTWIYDRCGWCPGMASDLKESDITSYVTPGVPADIDYTMLPDTGIGTSNYLVTNQLVTYGAMHFTNDAAVTDVMAPTNKIEYARSQAICNHPKIMIQNTGSAPLTTLTIEYWINANTTRSVYQWQGNLLPMQKEEVELPAFDLWVNVNSPDNVFHVELKNPNGAGDEYSFNNFFHSAFKITDVVPSDFIIYHRTNSAASETSYALYDVWDNLLFSRTGLTNLTTYRDTFHLAQGCYKFVMTDTDEDGISFWANSDGAGQVRFQRSNGTTLKTFNPDFGGSIIYNFTIDFPLSFESLEEAQWQVYPNPATDYLMVEFPDQGIEQYEVRNVLGQMQTVKAEKTAAGLKLDISQLPSGLYILKADIHGTPRTRKFRVQ